MRILLTGGTGLIGRALCQQWQSPDHTLWVWSRTPQRVADLCGSHVRGIGTLAELDNQPLDAIVNLAGAPIADRPWTAARRRLLRDSRIRLTQDLLDWLGQRKAAVPNCLISGSAVGWYGNGGDQILTEASQPAGTDFASTLCQDWEQVALQGNSLGMRVVLVRTGIVLARTGGFLPRLLPAFRLGLGGKLGNGQQWMPWIHLQDQVRLIDHLLRHPTSDGAYNACAPQPVRNADFTRDLARYLHRPAVMTVPTFLLKAGLGELSGLLLGGQRVLPSRLQAEGIAFRFTSLDDALADLLSH